LFLQQVFKVFSTFLKELLSQTKVFYTMNVIFSAKLLRTKPKFILLKNRQYFKFKSMTGLKLDSRTPPGFGRGMNHLNLERDCVAGVLKTTTLW
jgi:hypothetical protein